MPPWIHLFVIIVTVAGDVIFTREVCSADNFGGLQPVQGNPHKYRQCSGSGVVWIVPCQPGTLFDPVDRVCRADEIPINSLHKKYKPTPNSAIGITQIPAFGTTSAEEFLFTTRRPRPVRPLKGNRIKNGQRIRTSTQASTTLATLRPRTRRPPYSTKKSGEASMQTTSRPRSGPAFTPPQRSFSRSTTMRPIVWSTTLRPMTRRPRPTVTKTWSYYSTTPASIEIPSIRSGSGSASLSEEHVPTVGYRKGTTTMAPDLFGNSIDEDYHNEEMGASWELSKQGSMESNTPPLWIQSTTTTYPSTVIRPLSSSSQPRLPPGTIPTRTPAPMGDSTTTSPRRPPPFLPPSGRVKPDRPSYYTTTTRPVKYTTTTTPSTTTTTTTAPTTQAATESASNEISPEKFDSFEPISGEVIHTTSQYPTLMTYPPYILDKGKPMDVDSKSGADEKSTESRSGLSMADREFLQELMEMVRSQKTAEEKALKIEKERQRQILEKMVLSRPLVIPPRNSEEMLPRIIPNTGWTHVPEEEVEVVTQGGHIQTTKSSEEPYTKVHPYPNNIPEPLRPIYPGFSTPDIIRFTTQPPLDIIRFTPSPSKEKVEKSEWVTSSNSWKPPPNFGAETTEAPAELTLMTGCIIGTSCPLLGDSELLCEHPRQPSLYLQCVPTSFRGGIWAERSCPDTLVFIGDRCDKQEVRAALLAAGQPVIAVSEPPSGTPTTTPQPFTFLPATTPRIITNIPNSFVESNDLDHPDYLQWQRIGVPGKQPFTPRTNPIIRSNHNNMEKPYVNNLPNEMIDYSQVFPLFPRVQPSFLSPRNFKFNQRRRPNLYYGTGHMRMLRPIYDAPSHNITSTMASSNSTTSPDDFIVDKVVKPALKKIATDTSRSFMEMLVAQPVRQMDDFLAQRVEEIKNATIPKLTN